jgi:hypothetical protein
MEDTYVLVKNLLLSLLFLENLDELDFSSFFKRKLKSKTNSLKKELEKIPGAGFKALNSDSAIEHTQIYLQFSKEFDEFYNNFLKNNNLTT